MSGPFKYSIDGEILNPAEAFLALPDDGLLRGDGVFEVIRLYDGHPFALDAHLDRMERSAKAIDLPLDRAAMETEAGELIAGTGNADCLIRLIVTRSGRRIMSTEPLPAHAPEISLSIVTYAPTVILNGVKSLSYAANMQATRIARENGADEALLVRPDGIVLEAPTATLFWATPDGRLRTPSLDSGVLDSITRRKIVERVEVMEGEFLLENLLDASEAFLASTTREAHPVSRINDQALPTTNGPATKAATKAIKQALTEDPRG